jgi:hypothetical protein
MLERLQYYLIPALQIPLLLAFLVGWLIGGAYLLQKAARKYPQRELRTISMGKCAVAMFITGLLALLAGVMVMAIGVLFYQETESKVLIGVFAVIALIVMVMMGVLSINMQLRCSLKDSWTIGQRPLFGTMALLIVVVVAGFLPARARVMSGARRNVVLQQMKRINGAMRTYANQIGWGYPDTLENLLILQEEINEKTLKHPLRPELDVAFFYWPPSIEAAQENPAQAILAVSYAGKGNDGRAVMLYGGKIDWLSDAECKALLAEPVNEAFARELAKAEANLDETSGHVTYVREGSTPEAPEETPDE